MVTQEELSALTDAFYKFGSRRAIVFVSDVVTPVQILYSPDSMEIRELVDAPRIIRLGPNGTAEALIRGKLQKLEEKVARTFNIYRFFDPRVVGRGLDGDKANWQYIEPNGAWLGSVDILMAAQKSNFALNEELLEWLRERKMKTKRPVEAVLLEMNLLEMSLFEFNAGPVTLGDKFTLRFTTQ